MLDRLVGKTWGAAEPDGSYRRMVQDAAERSVLNGMMREAMNPDNPARVRAVLEDRLMTLGTTLAGMARRDSPRDAGGGRHPPLRRSG